MSRIVGVRFRYAGKVYDFDAGALEIKKGMHVIVDTARGTEYGEVVAGEHDTEKANSKRQLKSVLRVATAEDIERENENKVKEKEAFKICREKIRKHGLEMKLVGCEYIFDNSKIIFYFTADGRIDFRELVRDLAGVFRTRIELRQVGVRDETKILGGLGACGRQLCCNCYLSDFAPVSIKMAKDQDLPLNPSKISGVCGRLMCCLRNEEETYKELNKKLPYVGDIVETGDGLRGVVNSVSILKQLVKVVVSLPNDEKEIREYPAEELRVRSSRKKQRKKTAAADLGEKELLELENMEKDDGHRSRLND